MVKVLGLVCALVIEVCSSVVDFHVWVPDISLLQIVQYLQRVIRGWEALISGLWALGVEGAAL